MSELPRTIHLVSKAPHHHAVGLRVPIRDSGIRQSRSGANIGVLEHVECLLHAAGAKVHRVHQLAAGLIEPVGELVKPDLIGLGRVPSEVEARGALVPRADRVLPAKPRHEVAAGIPNRGYA